MTDVLSLSDLLTRRLYLRWYEGIAIVRGVAERLVGPEGRGTDLPELRQIELGADGSLTLAGGVPATEPVRRLGQLLQAMLTDAEVPVQLRLIVSQATAPIPSYFSLTELDQALAYFERPDRAGLLKALFARARAAGPATDDDAALTLDRLAPLPDATPTAPLPHRDPKDSRRLIATVATLIAVLALSGAAALSLRHARKAVKDPAASRSTVAASDAVGAAVLAGVSAVSDRVGLGRIVAAGAAGPSPPPAAAAPVADGHVARSVTTRFSPVGTSVASGPARRVVAYEAPEEPWRPIDVLLREADTPDQSTDAPIDSAIYAAGADGVSPPVGVKPQWRQEPPTADLADFSRIDLIIARDGSVESVKLLGNRHVVLGGMFLSAAKAWQFRPAMKDGVAVRYRKTILVSFE